MHFLCANGVQYLSVIPKISDFKWKNRVSNTVQYTWKCCTFKCSNNALDVHESGSKCQGLIVGQFRVNNIGLDCITIICDFLRACIWKTLILLIFCPRLIFGSQKTQWFFYHCIIFPTSLENFKWLGLL